MVGFGRKIRALRKEKTCYSKCLERTFKQRIKRLCLREAGDIRVKRQVENKKEQITKDPR